MKLYLVHCGFYDSLLSDGVYESHVNLFVAADSFEDARAKVKLIPEYQNKKMHVDGLQEISAVSGFHVNLSEDNGLEGKSIITSNRHRDLAPKAKI